MKKAMKRGRCGGWRMWAVGVAAAMLTVGAGAQTTNAWVLLGGTAGDWNTDANWDPSDGYPNSDTVVALFTNAYVGHVTNTLSADVTVNGIRFDDTTSVESNQLNIIGGNRTITFAGVDPFIQVNNGNTARIKIYTTTSVVNNATLTLWAWGGSQEFYSPVVGNGTLLVSRGEWCFLHVNNKDFTGDIIVTNVAGASTTLSGRGDNSYTHFGDTNGATYIYNSAVVQVMRDTAYTGVARSNAEPFHVYGVNVNGSIRFYNTSNTVYSGAITLHTNGVIGSSQWFSSAAMPVGGQRDMRLEGAIVDDGNARNLHFLHDITTSTTGTQTRLSRFVFGGVASHGGFTHVTTSKGPTGPDEYCGWLELTNGNDRLPVGTTMYLA